MGNTSTFGTFTVARLGIFVAQHALNTTGNNISNINTEGYTREKLDQSSMYFGGADRYQSKYDIRENGGVLANGVDQMRDQYLDIRYRNEMTKVGESDAKLDGLKQLDAILDEVAKGDDGEGVLEARFNDFIQQLQELSKDQNAGNDDIDALVRSSAEALAVQFNTYAKRLETLEENVTAQFKQELDATNTTLEKIRDLNETIRKTQIFGGTGLTLKDERNVLIDELSEKIGINVIYEMEDLGDGVEVEKLKITTSGDPSRVLIDGIYGSQLSIVQKGDDVPQKDEDGNLLLDEKTGRKIYDKVCADNDNFDLAISELTDARGKTDPANPNKVTTVVEQFKAFGKAGDAASKLSATAFETLEEAQAAAKWLNENASYYTNPSDPTKAYYYHVGDADDKDGESTKKKPFYIHQHDTVMQADGTPASSGEGYVSDEYRYVEVKTQDVTRLGDTELRGALQAMREMLTEEGEYTKADSMELKNSQDETDKLHYDPDAGTKRGIRYYQKALDTLANAFAEKLNNANTLVGTSPIKSFDDKTIYYTNKDGDFVGKDGSTSYVLNPDGETYTKKDSSGNPVGNNVSAAVAKQNFVLKEDYRKYFKQNDNGKFVDAAGKELEDQTDPTTFVPIAYIDKEAIYKTDINGNFVKEDGKTLLNEQELKDPANYVVKDEYKKYFQAERDPLTHEPVLKENYEQYQGGALFSSSGNTDDITGITAANISVSNSWAHGQTHVLRTKDSKADEQSRLQDNIRHIITVMGSKHDFKTGNDESGMKFNGTFQQMLTEVIAGTLAKDESITQTMLNNYNTTADEIYVDRDAVMGVDLNDEAMNMMQYQKAYSAACRLMTTYDALLDKLINGTAI